VGGRLTVEGEIGSLIDPAAGLDPLSTGRENIRLRALYRGLNAEQTAALEAEAGAFSGLGEFLDVPIHGYSAGMSIRLAFAMATSVQPQILLMDEWFSAGDADFMTKADIRLEQLVTASEILVIATHDMDVVKRWCNRVIKLEAGRIVGDGVVEGL
jgi:lipopolysaccharide transport system ATP-binding protein